MTRTRDPALGYEHHKAREAAIAAMPDGTPCPYWYCGHAPMYRTPAAAAMAGAPRRLWALAYDHIIPRVLGGAAGPRRLAHAHCNSKAGAILGNRIRAARARQYRR
jgi:hypothetical protein